MLNRLEFQDYQLKKLFAISLLSVFLFHSMGYYLVFLGFRYQANAEMAQRINAEQYGKEETITFKIPLVVPYYTDSKDYQRADGAFQQKGEFFKLVKQKLDRDTLYVVCIKDSREKALVAVMTDFVRMSNDLPGATQDALKLAGTFSKDYEPASSLFTFACSGWCRIIIFPATNFQLLTIDLPVFAPPPDLFS